MHSQEILAMYNDEQGRLTAFKCTVHNKCTIIHTQSGKFVN